MTTAWQPCSKWYDDLVGKEGHYYHQQIILPGVLRLLQLKPSSSLLDLACGQGVLARAIPQHLEYQGVDLSSSLIQSAKKQATPSQTFHVGDITQPLPLTKKNFTHAAIILALQNIENPSLALQQAAHHLEPDGTLVIVLNHPCFRIPRQTHWGIDEQKKIQYRRIDRYLSPLKIPIQTHPGKNEQATLSFHHPLSSFTNYLTNADFSIVAMEEWTSTKMSIGKAAKMENRAREEFPLFLAIKAKKNKI